MALKQGVCVDCEKFGPISGRGLCASRCYDYQRRQGTLEKFPRKNWKHEELMAELDLCRMRGLSVREAAEKIGVSLSALRKAIDRARARAARCGSTVS